MATREIALFDVISLQGAILDHILSSSGDSILKFQVHVLLPWKYVHSKPVNCSQDKNVIFDFPISTQFIPDISPSSSQVYIFVSYYSQTEFLSGNSCVGLHCSEKTICAQAVVDLSLLQLYSGAFLSVELQPCLHDYVNTGESSVGVLYLKVGGLLSFHAEWSNDESVNMLLSQKQTIIATKSRQVFHAVKVFWSRLQEEYPFLQDRPLRFMIEDECGRLRYIGSNLAPIYSSRQLQGSSFAARFVSLIPYRKVIGLSGGRVLRCQSPFSMLCSLKGDVEDHCFLLCNLLLGWGLQAYIALGSLQSTEPSPFASTIPGSGSNSSNPSTNSIAQTMHTWVVTFQEGQWIFWESLTGQTLTFQAHQRDCLKDSHFGQLWALISPSDYWVNVQRDAQVVSTQLDMTEPRFWQRWTIPDNLREDLLHPGVRLQLQENFDMNHNILREISNRTLELETRIKLWMKDIRTNQGWQINFDSHLEHLLQGTFLSYELERSSGYSMGMKDFQAGVKRLVGKMESMKAFPTCFNHCHIDRILRTLQQSTAAMEIVYTTAGPKSGPGGQLIMPKPARFAVRVQIFDYPQQTSACWVILAVIAQSSGSNNNS